MDLLRFTVGRWLVHAGLSIMPDGRPRRELFALFAGWGEHVKATLAAGAK